eukprot:11220327-Lingulodinium_polyedra.AAC.1
MPLHAGPEHAVEAVADSGYVKLYCTLCKQTAELARCRGRARLKHSASHLEEDRENHVVWDSEFLWEGDEAE